MIRADGRREEAGEFEPVVAVRRAHHGDLDALIAESSDAPGLFSFDGCLSFEFQAEVEEDINGCCQVVDDDSHVVHAFERLNPNVQAADRNHLSYDLCDRALPEGIDCRTG